MVWRQARRWLRDEHRHASNRRESILSSLSGLVIGVVLTAIAGIILACIAGLSRYIPIGAEEPASVRVLLDRSGEGLTVALRGLPASPRIEPVIAGGWFSIAAYKVGWRGPLRWAGFADSIRPYAVLDARSRADLGDSARIRRSVFAPGSLFETVLRGPASSLGLWTFEEVRSPWRPAKAGSMECLFTEGGSAVVSP